jgi:hypothetical protein
MIHIKLALEAAARIVSKDRVLSRTPYSPSDQGEMPQHWTHVHSRFACSTTGRRDEKFGIPDLLALARAGHVMKSHLDIRWYDPMGMEV